MGSLYRSEEMSLCQLFLQSEAAYACVSELGEIGLAQFRDLNPSVNAFQRKFVNEVRRCDEMERKLRFMDKELTKEEIPSLDTGDNPMAPAPKEMVDLEASFDKLDNELREVNGNTEALKRNFLELTDLKHILRKTQYFFEEAELLVHNTHDYAASDDDTTRLLSEDITLRSSRNLGFVAGVIQRERLAGFERMLWRACHGNVFLKQTEIEIPLEDPATGDEVYKSVFIIFFQGEQLKTRVKKICEGFRATLYPCPETTSERREMAIGVMTRLEDLNTVLTQTNEHRHRILMNAAKNIKVWFIKVRKIKAIYHTLNMFNLDVTQKCLIAECWCPVKALAQVQQALRAGTERSGSGVPSILNRMVTLESPPTFFKTNKFTTVFQSIIDAYGVATYREVNPAPFSFITFPFLFSVMFGDSGHALIMFIFGLYLVLNEKTLDKKKGSSEIFDMIYGGRYIILLMGAFSIYAGLLYNDVFAKSLNIFGSSWYPDKGKYSFEVLNTHKALTLDPASKQDFSGIPYPFGMDPIWQLASNKITFHNSFKMKISVIFGVMQMTLGVILSLRNHSYFRRPINIFCEFIPEILFLMSIFGYLCILIFYKWVVFNAESSFGAPSLLIHLIDMFLFKYPKSPPSAVVFYTGQEAVQFCLLGLAAVCAMTMLFMKPFILYWQHRSRSQQGHVHTKSDRIPVITADELEIGDEDQDLSGPSSVAPARTDEEEEFEFGEVFIHQAIHTIEFCLGCISHTASYLRLWALSLAHAELSEVLWTMVLKIGLGGGSFIGAAMIVPTFAFWVGTTIAVLLLMEGLSAFLHTLRLHWVEFQSKFYKGEGYAFIPFSFATIIQEASNSD